MTERVSTPLRLELMDNLPPAHTGVEGAVIWASAGEFADLDIAHGPRVLVLPGAKITNEGLSEAASIRLTDPPEVVGHLPDKIKPNAVEFVRTNRATLLHYWNNEIDTKEMVDSLVRVR